MPPRKGKRGKTIIDAFTISKRSRSSSLCCCSCRPARCRDALFTPVFSSQARYSTANRGPSLPLNLVHHENVWFKLSVCCLRLSQVAQRTEPCPGGLVLLGRAGGPKRISSQFQSRTCQGRGCSCSWNVRSDPDTCCTTDRSRRHHHQRYKLSLTVHCCLGPRCWYSLGWLKP